MSKNERRFVPRLRFPEFRDAGEWNSLAGNELFDQISNKTHNSDLPILAITQDLGAVPRNIIGYQISVTKTSLESYKIVEIGDFIISLRSFQGGIEYSLYKGICSPAYIILRKRKCIYDYFYKYYFKSFEFIRQMNRNLEGLRDGKMVSFKQFSELILPNPQPDEQQKIADCLSSIDELISLHTQKLNALKDYKKGLMQQLFPAEGEKVPRLRFPEFRDAGEWRIKTLDSYSTIVRGGSPRPIIDYLTDDEQGLNWLKIGDVHQNSKYVTSTNEKVRIEALNKTREVKPGDLILSNSMSFGRPYLMKIKSCIHDGWIAVTNINKKVNRNFLYYFILSENSQKFFKDSAAGGGVKNLNAEIIKLLPISIPKNEKEQQKIADCLSSIDEKISTYRMKVQSLRANKKGLLQQLFPTSHESA